MSIDSFQSLPSYPNPLFSDSASDSIDPLTLLPDSEIRLSDSPELKEALQNEISPDEFQALQAGGNKLLSEIQHTQTKINKKIKDYLEKTPADTPPELKAMNIMLILEKYSGELAEKMETAEHLHANSEKAELPLNTLLQLLALGTSVAEKCGVDFEPEVLCALNGMQMSNTITELVSVGFSCFFIQKQAQHIKAMEQQQATLMQLIDLAPSQKKDLHLQTQLDSLEIKISAEKSELKANVGKSIYAFAKLALKTSTETLEVVASAPTIEAHANIVSHLMLASDSLSLAGALLSLGWNSYQVVSSSKKLFQMQSKVAELKDLANKSEDLCTTCIIKAKIDRLENTRKDLIFNLGLKTTLACNSSLMIAVGITGIIAASGVAMGTAAATFMTASTGIGIGITAAAIGLPTAILVYQNRYNIEHLAKTSLPRSQKIVRQTQLKLENRRYADTEKTLQKLEGEQKTAQRALQNNIDNLPSASRSDSRKVISDMKALEKSQKKNFKKLTKALEKTNEYSLAVANIKENQTKIIEDVAKLTDKTKASKDRRDVKNLVRKFRTYDAYTLQVVRKAIRTGLQDPKSRLQVEKFLLSQKFPADNLTEEKVMSYITSKK